MSMAMKIGPVANRLQRALSHCSPMPIADMMTNRMTDKIRPSTALMSKDYHLAISTKRKKD